MVDYSIFFKTEIINAFYQTLPPKKKAEFEGDLNTIRDFIRTANHGLIEILESYALDRDSEGNQFNIGLLINMLYTLKNNSQIESALSDYLAYMKHSKSK